MKKLVTTIVIAGTALAIAPAAQAGQYAANIDSCKAAIAEKTGGEKITALLGNVKRKSGAQVQLDFKVKVVTGTESKRMKARCLTTRAGEVVELTLS